MVPFEKLVTRVQVKGPVITITGASGTVVFIPAGISPAKR
jgi:hypothetical protein